MSIETNTKSIIMAGNIYHHSHQGPGFPGPPGAVPPPPGYRNGGGGYPGPPPPPPPPPQSYQGYYNEGGGYENYPPPRHISHHSYGYDQTGPPCSSLLRACFATLCYCFICEECCFF